MIKQTILKYLHYAINKKHYYIYIFNKQTTLYYLLYTINKQTIINLLYAINKQSILYVYHIININISSCLFVFKCCFKSLQKYNIYNGVVNPWQSVMMFVRILNRAGWLLKSGSLTEHYFK